MPESMILDRQIVPRRWQLVEALPAEGSSSLAPILPLSAYLSLAPEAREGVGVSLGNADDLTGVLDHLEALPVIALAFPSWRDGRAYSQARKLRHLHGFRGVILAHGDVLRDQLLYMSRVGFNAFHMRDDQDLQASLRAFALYSAYYQY